MINRYKKALDIIIIVLLSFLFPGLGHIYFGLKFRGYIYIILYSLSILSVLLTFGFIPIFLLITWIITNLDMLFIVIKVVNNTLQAKDFKSKRTFLAASIYLLLIVTMVILNNVSLTGIESFVGMGKEKLEIERHLQNKYGENFTVNRVKYYVPSIGVKAVIEAKITYGKVNFVTNRYKSSTEYRDNLYDLLWAKECENEISSFLYSQYGSKYINNISITVHDSVKSKILGKVIHYNEAVNIYPDIFNGKLSYPIIQILIFQNMNNDLKYNEAEKIYNFIKYLQTQGIERFRLIINYSDESFEQEAKKIISKIGFVDFIDIEKGYKIDRYYKPHNALNTELRIQTEQIELIKSSNDILKYFN